MKNFRRFVFSGVALTGAAVAIGLVLPQRLGSQYATPVNVMNSKAAPALIRDTDNPARAPYFSNVVLPLSGTCNSVSDQAVPAGKTLVVEFLSAKLFVDTGVKPYLTINQANPAQTASYELDLPAVFAGLGGNGDLYIVAQPVKLYVPSLQSLQFGTCQSGGSGFSLGGHVVVSGYLITN